MIDNKDAEIERLHGRVTENILFIVRRDAIIREKDDRIEHLENDLSQCVQWKDKQIAELVQVVAEYRKEIIEKDEEIRVLEETIREMRGFL